MLSTATGCETCHYGHAYIMYVMCSGTVLIGGTGAVMKSAPVNYTVARGGLSSGLTTAPSGNA